MGFAFTVISNYSGLDIYSYRPGAKRYRPGSYQQAIKGPEK